MSRADPPAFICMLPESGEKFPSLSRDSVNLATVSMPLRHIYIYIIDVSVSVAAVWLLTLFEQTVCVLPITETATKAEGKMWQ